MPELLRREVTRMAARPSVAEWLARVRQRSDPGYTGDVLEALDELRGPWPDAGR